MKAVFECPWGCAEISRAEGRGLGGSFFHENAWECPMFSQRLLKAVEAFAARLDPGDPETRRPPAPEVVPGA